MQTPTTSGSTMRTARERARAEVRAEILATARRHLAVDGAAALSLRAVARELGVASSAVYRYVASRDELLTALIVAAYDALGEAAEAAAQRSAGAPLRERWVAVAVAIRDWAVAHPHEYALLYGSPVPGYAAPTDTVVPGTRVSLALVGLVRDAVAAGEIPRGDATDVARGADAPPLADATVASLRQLRELIDVGADDRVLLDLLLGWTQLFGLLSFELFSQTRGLVHDHAAFFVDAVGEMADRIGR